VNISRNARIVGIFGSGLLIPPTLTQRFLLFNLLRAVIVGTFNFLSPLREFLFEMRIVAAETVFAIAALYGIYQAYRFLTH
jgi:hypothetical protein